MADEDDDVTIRIRVDGGPMPGGMLDQMMREQGVRVVSRSSAKEERDWESAIGAAAAITTLVVEGGRPAIRVLPTSLSGDLAAALREHGSATLDEHYGHSHQPWPMPGLRCQHHVGRSSADAP